MDRSGILLAKTKRKIGWKWNDLLKSIHLKHFRSPTIPIQRILVYHGIDELGNTEINSRFISEQIFEEQLLLFKQHFHVVSLQDYYNGNFHSHRPTIALTFDDGYANNLHRALPLLEKHKTPATFFITTIRKSGYDMLWPDALDLSCAIKPESFELHGERFSKSGKKGYCSEKTGIPLKASCKNTGFDYKKELLEKLPGLQAIKSNKTLNDYHVLLNEKEIKQLSDSSLATIGSHGLYHNCLERIPIKDAVFEMRESKQYLEKIIGKEVNSLAFPDGSYSNEVIQEALKIGYTKLLGGDSLNVKENEFLNGRLVINPHISTFNQLISIIKGKY